MSDLDADLAKRVDLEHERDEALRLIKDAQGVLEHYLRPEGITAEQAIDELLGLLDGPRWRRIAGIEGSPTDQELAWRAIPRREDRE